MNTSKLFRTGLLALTFAASSGIIAPRFADAAPKSGAMMGKALRGTFKQVTHATSGVATVQGRTLTLSNFETGMGPQLHVYLVQGGASSNGAVKAAVSGRKFVDLGSLKSIKGAQSYAIPASAKTQGASVVIWCDKFDVAFGAAKLS